MISRSVFPDQGDGHQDHALHHGNELLRGLVPEYEADRPGPVSGYTLDAVWQALNDVGVPPDTPSWVSGARSLFAGYLLLDGLIGNTDRHHQNWAVVRPPDGRRDYLSPSFDHASCLGFQEPQERKARLLAEGRVEHWTRRAKSKFEGQPSPIQVARQALGRLSATEAGWWRERVDALRDSDWLSRIEAIPADLMSADLMSQVDRTFAAEVMRMNRKELLDVG